jgi:hypothetical protein
LAPVTQPALAAILQSVPTTAAFSDAGVTPPDIGNLDPDDLGHINGH